MNENQKPLPTWALVVSGLIALMEIAVGISLFAAPESMLETVDLKAKGVEYVVQMWAVRQFALGFIFAFGAFRRSVPMLKTAYIFFLVMFVGDLVIGALQGETSLVIAAVVMILISSALIFVLNKKG